MTSPYVTNRKCPRCQELMTYEPAIPPIIGGPPDKWDPGSSSDLWCGRCGYQATDEELKEYEDERYDSNDY